MTLISVTNNLNDKALNFQALQKARFLWIAIYVSCDSASFQRFTALITISCVSPIAFSSKNNSQSCCSKIPFCRQYGSRI